MTALMVSGTLMYQLHPQKTISIQLLLVLDQQDWDLQLQERLSIESLTEETLTIHCIVQDMLSHHLLVAQ